MEWEAVWNFNEINRFPVRYNFHGFTARTVQDICCHPFVNYKRLKLGNNLELQHLI